MSGAVWASVRQYRYQWYSVLVLQFRRSANIRHQCADMSAVFFCVITSIYQALVCIVQFVWGSVVHEVQ